MTDPCVNAIDRLRDGLHNTRDYDPDCPECQRNDTALAAVDALYQAAKARLADDGATQYDEGCDCPTCALAAAVRRIEGTA